MKDPLEQKINLMVAAVKGIGTQFITNFVNNEDMKNTYLPDPNEKPATSSKTWKEIIHAESQKDYYKKIIATVQEDSKYTDIYPAHDKIFEAFKLTPFKNVKVIILGQDAYHGEGQAHGLAFSVQKGVPVPPSLKNIYKELNDDLKITAPIHGCLESWAKQGVLLLNASLTVKKGIPNSHKSIGWHIFTDKIISELNEHAKQPLVFILWGVAAQSKSKLITNTKHKILTAAHPSPYSVYGFWGTKPFSKANAFLTHNNIKPINWEIK
jgi:uracil-DNA glycosylase